METKTITAELTKEQYERYEILIHNDMDIGDAIDLIFDLRDKLEIQSSEFLEDRVVELYDKRKSLEEEMNTIDEELGILDKLKNDELNFKQKQEIFEKELMANETYELKAQHAKQQVSWVKDVFKL